MDGIVRNLGITVNTPPTFCLGQRIEMMEPQRNHNAKDEHAWETLVVNVVEEYHCRSYLPQFSSLEIRIQYISFRFLHVV